jgi:5-methylcytosine-specific restriction protein B
MQHARFLNALAAKPFVILTGNSGTGKTKLAELFARWVCGNDSSDYALVPVGSDWSDNRSVLGFVNHLQKASAASDSPPVYQSTPILNLILRAVEHPHKPHFLILDEMNLSHVERYFADFLSAMESQSRELLLHTVGQGATRLPTAAGGEPKVDGKVRLPDNLFVIGTVNVDETTYMFSPKVLDRANVLEFRTGLGGLEDFFKAGSSGVSEVTPADPSLGAGFLALSRSARRGTLPEFPSLDQVQAALKDVFQIMEAERLEFGFRTVNEILRYLRVDLAVAENPEAWDWKPVFDDQILQKILPKLNGSKRRLEGLLVKLAWYCEEATVPPEGAKVPPHFQSDPVKRASVPAFPRSYSKLCGMIDVVRRDQFVSFIQ